MANANVFAESPEVIHPDRVKKLRNKILKDVARKVPDEELLKFRDYAIYTSVLPPLGGFPAEFRQLFVEGIIDEDMRDDLQQHDVINWCTACKKLYPIKTTADGNCLLHAVSKYVFGVDDRDLFLRRLLYVNLSSDSRGRFKKRWLVNQRASIELQGADVRLDTEEYGVEWDSILRATEDATQTGNAALPYCTLESVHLYAVANLFRRPVIVLADRLARNVYGQSIQENHLGGIYLPLEWAPTQCHKNPIILGYNMNHFAPMLMEDGALPGGLEQAVPIVTKLMVSMELQFLLPDEEPRCSRLLEEYFQVTEVVHAGQDGIVPIPSVRVIHKLLPTKYDMIDVYRMDCERRFRRIMDQEAGLVQPPAVQIPPFEFRVENRNNDYIVMGNNVLPKRAINIVGNKTVPPMVPEQREEMPKTCITMGCQMFGNPEMGYHCSKCFKDFTIQFNKQEEALKKQQKKSQKKRPQGVPARNIARPDEYHDLSMMGEDCKCGFKCSVETYPYCHECFPGPGNTNRQNVPARPIRQQPVPAEVEMSMMPDKCHGQNCTFQCSKATFPYCHECFDRYANVKEVPTAPPPSVPMEVDPVNPGQNSDPNLQLRIQAQGKKQKTDRKMEVDPSFPTGSQQSRPVAITPQTQAHDMTANTGERMKKCKTEGCNNQAIRGNNGTCDECYNVSLFGAGNNSSPVDEGVLDHLRNLNENQAPRQCLTPSCQEEVTYPSTQQCLECFLRGDFQVPVKKTQQANTEKGHHNNNQAMNVAMNISIPESMGDEKILNSGAEKPQETGPLAPSLQVSGPPLSGSLGIQEPVQRSNGEPAVHEAPTVTSPERQGTAGSTSGTYRKYICATAGCEGIRNDNGYCFSCTRNLGVRESPAEATCSSMQGRVVTNPVSEGEEGSHLLVSCSPVILTEQQKREMNPVITSSRQKVRCASPSCNKMIYPPRKLCEECSTVLDRYQANRSLDHNKKSVGAIGVPCLTPGCQFFGSPQTGNYCSSCYKSGASRHTAPVSTKKSPANGPSRYTAPLATTTKPTGKQCIEPNCTRFGDPAQADRCSQHYKEAMARIPPNLSPQSIERYYNGPANERTVKSDPSKGQNVACVGQKRAHSDPIAMETETTPQVDPLVVVMNKVEGSRKSSQLCKNNSMNGCQNYGNSKNKGYCNTCFPDMLRHEDLQRTQMAGQNQFG